ncbi:MAG: polysaccharide pyruvyl transferase family protein, partial [Nanoarchaeota archaeon]|nr:polysaccharide pyruvyl transferase family protein [Nanoarchaeota archaeon]
MNVAISGWYGNANIGDEAILHQLVSTLKKEYPNIEITVFSDTPQETIKKHGVNALPQSYITGNLKMINCLSKTDVLIVGGGSLITEYSNNLWMLRIFLCKLFGKKIITYGLG